jgi:hypothetical protein
MTEPIKISTGVPYEITYQNSWSAQPPPKREGLHLLFIPLMVLTFLSGLIVGSMVERERPIAEDPGFVNIEGHQGEVLVVGMDGEVLWTTEAELHKAAGHTGG